MSQLIVSTTRERVIQAKTSHWCVVPKQERLVHTLRKAEQKRRSLFSIIYLMTESLGFSAD